MKKWLITVFTSLMLIGVPSIAFAYAHQSPNQTFSTTTHTVSSNGYNWYVGTYGDHIHLTSAQYDKTQGEQADVVYQIGNGMPNIEVIKKGSAGVDWYSSNVGYYNLVVWSGACYNNYQATGVIHPTDDVYGNLYVNW